MIKKLLATIAVLAGLISLQCSSEPTPPDDKEIRELTEAEKQLVASDNLFGLKLFREIVAQEPDNNIFISPLSVAMALGMTYNGARDETREAMREVLELHGMNLQEVNESYRNLIDLLRNLDPKVKFQIANSIWSRQGFAVEQDFIDLNRTYFDAVVQALDFSDPAAIATINNWVDENTNGKITEIIDEINPEIVMFLINAIYFKGDWADKFDKEDTKEASFTLPDNTQSTCRMMFQHDRFHYFRGTDFAAVDLPYGDGNYSMTIFLPDSVSQLDALIARLTTENWEEWLSSFHETELSLHLPKFELEYELELNDILKALGMEIAFDPAMANFTGINSTGELYIDEVKHKTYVKVDEEGTEAAAVTSVAIGYTSINLMFRADHPFVFAIREHHSGTILFIGKMVDPVWP